MTDEQTILTLAQALKNSDQAIMVDGRSLAELAAGEGTHQ